MSSLDYWVTCFTCFINVFILRKHAPQIDFFKERGYCRYQLKAVWRVLVKMEIKRARLLWRGKNKILGHKIMKYEAYFHVCLSLTCATLFPVLFAASIWNTRSLTINLLWVIGKGRFTRQINGFFQGGVVSCYKVLTRQSMRDLCWRQLRALPRLWYLECCLSCFSIIRTFLTSKLLQASTLNKYIPQASLCYPI